MNSQKEIDALCNNALKQAWNDFAKSQGFDNYKEINKEFIAVIKFTFKSGFESGVKFVADCVQYSNNPNERESSLNNSWILFTKSQGLDHSHFNDATPTIKFTFNTSYMYGVTFTSNTLYPN